MRKIDTIIVHCSASSAGCARLINDWHLSRGFNSIGYHFVILNGRPYQGAKYMAALDGQIEVGRPLGQVGAHCKGYNRHSIGVCLIGRDDFTVSQFRALAALCDDLESADMGPLLNIIPHAFYNKKKSCPNFDVEGVLNEYRKPCERKEISNAKIYVTNATNQLRKAYECLSGGV